MDGKAVELDHEYFLYKLLCHLLSFKMSAWAASYTDRFARKMLKYSNIHISSDSECF